MSIRRVLCPAHCRLLHTPLRRGRKSFLGGGKGAKVPRRFPVLLSSWRPNPYLVQHRPCYLLFFLDSRPAGEPSVSLTVAPPVPQRAHKGQEPQQRAGEVDPDGVLHALDARVALGVLVDVHAAENPEKGDPQDEEDQVPGPDEPEAEDEGDEVDEGGDGGQGADDLGVDPLRVLVLVGPGGAVQVDAVEAADGEGEGELDDVDGREDQVGEGHAEETHLGGGSWGRALRLGHLWVWSRVCVCFDIRLRCFFGGGSLSFCRGRALLSQLVCERERRDAERRQRFGSVMKRECIVTAGWNGHKGTSG